MRYLFFILILAAALWYFNNSCANPAPKPAPAPVSGTPTSGEMVQGQRMSGGKTIQTQRPSVRPDFEKVCKEYNVIIVKWSESNNVVDCVVKSRDFNAPNDILDPLIPQGILKDVINFDDRGKRFQVREDSGEYWWYVHHVLRAYKD